MADTAPRAPLGSRRRGEVWVSQRGLGLAVGGQNRFGISFSPPILGPSYFSGY